MDKLRLSLSGSTEDFTRLYSSWDGFQNMAMPISLPAEQSLSLFLISRQDYKLVIEGDATIEKREHDSCQSFHFFFVRWSPEAQEMKSGSAVVSIVNPDCPKEPMLLQLTLGEFSCGASSDKREKPGQSCPGAEFVPGVADNGAGVGAQHVFCAL